MKTPQSQQTPSGGSDDRLVRRFPIDFRAIAAETGCTKGTIGHNSMFGWHVQNGNGPADFCKFTPPEIAEGETLRIEGREWAVYSANRKINTQNIPVCAHQVKHPHTHTPTP